ncbi:zf-HC2 domain-containing protein [Agathobaculum sp. Marseille-P7918]|uniref:zf-HC2 domain-containing protein n=1 Tax=Agathobaculum sp. Marseille-P7918 TaxID=2479843 RepID=UPI000F633C81|nr:zf-HC2 domain-containing protein [Agathobaculum sp. Marseille-P7918]
MSNQCNLIKDILPLYVEDMVSTDTKEFVNAHLEHCAECRAELERMRGPAKFVPDIDIDTDIVPLKRIKKDLFIRRLQTIFFTAIIACAVVMIVFGVLTSPKFFPYSDDLLNVVDNHSGEIIVTFDDRVTGYTCTKEFYEETEIYRINAWTTTWDIYFSNRGNQNVVIPFNDDSNIQIFFTQNNGSEDVLIYGERDNLPQAVITLPRQILLPYFLLAALALIVLSGLRLLLKNKKAIIVWIDRAILLPISYMAAQLCTKGINFTTYSSQRDFCIIVLVAILFYLALLTGKSIYQEKRADKSTERFKEWP